MRTSGLWLVLVIVLGAAACRGGSTEPPVFVEGRAVVPVGDTILAFTADPPGALLVVHPVERRVDTIGLGVLRSPVHAQWMHGRWYVSDTSDEGWEIVVFTPDGTRERTISLADISPTAHQFATLPDGRIVVIGRAQQLVAVGPDAVEVFALADAGERPSHLLGVLGGVLHAVPDQDITLYNGFGHIRWRVEWPWASTAYVSDLSVDGAGRIHVIAGIAAREEFIVYSIVPTTGEVVRWSPAASINTFVVGRFGEVRADSTRRWWPGG